MSSFFDNLTDLLVVGAFPAAILLAVYKFWTSGRVRLPNPKLGLMNLGGEEFTAILNEDRVTFGPLFDNVVVSTDGSIPQCNVLFLYADVASDGSIGGAAESSVRQFALSAGAALLVVASNNPSERIAAAHKRPGSRNGSLVFTIDRRGDGFGRFFKEIFTLMKAGKTMPMAWAKIAPQHESVMPKYAPVTILLPEGKFVVFR
jgi:hypothetical protein